MLCQVLQHQLPPLTRDHHLSPVEQRVLLKTLQSFDHRLCLLELHQSLPAGLPDEPSEVDVLLGKDLVGVVGEDRLDFESEVEVDAALEALVELEVVLLREEFNDCSLELLARFGLMHLNVLYHAELFKQVQQVLFGHLQVDVAEQTLVHVLFPQDLLDLTPRLNQQVSRPQVVHHFALGTQPLLNLLQLLLEQLLQHSFFFL